MRIADVHSDDDDDDAGKKFDENKRRRGDFDPSSLSRSQISRWGLSKNYSFRITKMMKKKKADSGKVLDADHPARSREAAVVDPASDSEARRSEELSIDSGRRNEDFSVSFGMSVGLVFLLAKGATEFNKLTELRAEMEMLLKEIKHEVRRKYAVASSSESDNNISFSPSHCCWDIDTSKKTSMSKYGACFSLQEAKCYAESDSGSKYAAAFANARSLSIGQMEAELEAELERLQHNLEGQGSSVLQHRMKMSQSHIGETNPTMSGNTTTPAIDNQHTQSNQTNPSTGASEMKKRKMSSRSDVWDHYMKWDEEIDEMREEGEEPLLTDECRCLHCRKVYSCNTKKNGTYSLRNHIKNCKENPHNKETRQAQLSLQPTREDGRVGNLSTWKYDEKTVRLGLSKMIILDELPFKFVEGAGFKLFMSILCPKFVIPSRWTIGRDIYQIYLDEKVALKKYLNTSSHYVCLTTDTWTSIQRINYMCLTAHWIGSDWNLHKRILNFCPITSHRGEVLGTALEACLHDWGIEKVLTITVDNASSNDKMIQYLRRKIVNWNDKHGTFLGGEYLHVRCVAHIMNLVVQDGLEANIEPIARVRSAIKYVKQSPSRWAKWKACVEKEKIAIETGMCLDVPTRWNSTFLMLQAAKKCQSAFYQFELEDPMIRQELAGHSGRGRMPDEDDWECVGRLCRFLQTFYDLTLKISGTLYVTSNVLLHQITNVECELHEAIMGDDILACEMAEKMKEKYEKYWGNCEKINLLIFIALILDPRFKLDFAQYVITEMFKSLVERGLAMASKLEKTFKDLFNKYKTIHNKENDIKEDAQIRSSIKI